jgi:hypothetical protein
MFSHVTCGALQEPAAAGMMCSSAPARLPLAWRGLKLVNGVKHRHLHPTCLTPLPMLRTSTPRPRAWCTRMELRGYVSQCTARNDAERVDSSAQRRKTLACALDSD